MRIYHLVEAESLWALSQRGAVNLPQVKELQDRLRAAGFDPGPSDGWYGKRTADAVRAYQQANNLKVDGDAGPQTLGRLGMGGANNTAPRETPPEETPPAPAPRQSEREPADQPAREPEPAPTRREPEPAPTTVPFSNLRPRGTISLPSNLNARAMRNAINQISEINLRLTDFVGALGSNAPMVDIEVDVSNYNLSYTQRRQVGRNILDFLQEKFVSSNDMELEVRVDDTEGSFLVTRTTVFIDGDASTSPTDREAEPTRSEPEQTPANDEYANVDWNNYRNQFVRLITFNFFDAESARFRNWQIRRTTAQLPGMNVGTYFLTGEVNAKNRQNAYVGFTPFYTLAINILDNGNVYAPVTIPSGDRISRGVDERMIRQAIDASELIQSLNIDTMPTQNESIQRLSKLAGL